jgi:hypothetical protein
MKVLPKIIGLSAKQHCGKSTLAQLLVKRFHMYKIMAVGDELKKDCSERFEVPLAWFHSQEGKRFEVKIKKHIEKVDGHRIEVPAATMTVRNLMTWWGTDVVRKEVDDLYWLKKLVASIGDKGHVIIEDVRFYNEAEYVRKAGGLLIRLEPYEGRGKIRGDGHISEIALDDYEYFDLVVSPAFGTLPKLADAINIPLLMAAKASWQKIVLTKEYATYTHCIHGSRPFKHLSACMGCTRKCKMIKRYQMLTNHIDAEMDIVGRTFTRPDLDDLAKAC